jgi:hypothetical protein
MPVIRTGQPFEPGALEPALLQVPLGALNLSVRASHCLSDVATLAELLALTEVQLMRRRNFGRATLVDVRRKLVSFVTDHADDTAGRHARRALYDTHPAIEALWNTPAQARPVSAVVAELIELLARPEDLRRAERWTYSTTRIGPPQSIDLGSVSLAELVEAVFGSLKERERKVLERRLGPLHGEGATLAEVGREFGLTRERVRQIVQACCDRLGREEEQRRRTPLTERLARALADSGGLCHERCLAAALTRDAPAPHPELGPMLRVVLIVEERFRSVSRHVWALTDVPAERIAAVQEAFHARLRASARPLDGAALTAELARDAGLAPAFLNACLETDPRLRRLENGRFAVREMCDG